MYHYIGYPNFFFFFCTVILPPVAVQATQSSSSAPVEVSWSPPISEGDVTVTGYRIFYSSGENASVPTIFKSVGLIVDRNYVGEIVFLRSESGWLYSELINVTVGELFNSAP